MAFYPVECIAHLNEFKVKFLIVGNVANIIQQAPLTTNDIDIMVDPVEDNLLRLASALSFPDTKMQKWGSRDLIDCPVVDVSNLKTDKPTRFVTKFGVVDVMPELPAVGFYDDVLRNAKEFRLDGTPIWVGHIDDIISSKEAADRVKDWAAMPALYETREYCGNTATSSK